MTGLLRLLACAAGGQDSGDPLDTASYFAAPDIAPVWGLDELDAGLADGISGGAVFPLTFYDTWVAVVDDIGSNGPNNGTEKGCDGGFLDSETLEDHQTAECFSFEGTEGQVYSIQGGWIGDVYASTDRDVTEHVANVLYSFRGERLATGDQLYGGGHLSAGWRLWEESITYDLMLQGTYEDDGAADASSLTIGAGTWWTGTWSQAGFVTANFEGPTGSGEGAIDFRSFYLDAASGPGPTGALDLRDPSGGWWALSFADDYSGCGTATFDGVPMGDTCAGLAAVGPLGALFADAQAAGW